MFTEWEEGRRRRYWKEGWRKGEGRGGVSAGRAENSKKKKNRRRRRRRRNCWGFGTGLESVNVSVCSDT